MFACTTIEGKSYVDIYMEDECWTGDHALFSITVAIPAFILWGLGFPFLAFLTLHRINKVKGLEVLKNKQVYGFLYIGYLPKKYWWELLILARKVTILVTLIWIS